MRVFAIAATCLCLSARAFAIGPHELLVVYDRSSRDSVRVAQEFARLRHVPVVNLVALDLPHQLSGALRITREEFTRHIWNPVNAAAHAQGVDNHALAWAYSVDIPLVVGKNPGLSIQGITFVRNAPPTSDIIDIGSYASPLFAGPLNRGERARFPATLDSSKSWLRAEMPLPSMMLGVTGDQGNTVAEVLACLRRGVAADGTRPTGTIYFATSDDVRSTCRDWQFGNAVKELARLGVAAEITSALPHGQRGVMGVMAGTPVLTDPDKIGFAPGAMAEHLTSFGGAFHRNHRQSRLTEWIAAGATASSGTVVEPYAKWLKFPNARFFVNYAAGCTMIESFYQSVRAPLQLLVVGDPLCQPWKPRVEIELAGVPHGPVSGILKLHVSVKKATGLYFSRFVFLVDGRVVQRGRPLKLDTTSLSNGKHVLRAVAVSSGMVRRQGFVETQIDVRN